MTLKMEGPAATGMANGANIEAAGFSVSGYRKSAISATSFEPVGLIALRVVHLASRHGLTIERAVMLAPMIFGEGRA